VTVYVTGITELNRAFAHADKQVQAGLRVELATIAEPVRVTAQQLALTEITNMTEAWSQMRVGTTGKFVYVAPQSRRKRGSPRPNLAGLLMDRALQPAADANEGKVADGVEHLVDRIMEWG